MFRRLQPKQQHAFMQVAAMELATYIRWQRAQPSGAPQDAAVFDALPYDEKVAWVPEDPAAVLASDGRWPAAAGFDCGTVAGNGDGDNDGGSDDDDDDESWAISDAEVTRAWALFVGG